MRPRSFVALLVLAGALWAPASVAPAQEQDPAPGSVGIRLLEAPVSARDDPRALVYIVDHVEAGTTFSRGIEVENTTDSDLSVNLYVVPAKIAGGEFTPGERDQAGEVAEWASVSPGRATIPSRAAAQARVEIAVPDDAEDGEYYGAALAEVTVEGAEINVVNRVGIRIYLSVGDGDAPKSDFEISTLTSSRREDGTPVVSASVTNTGGRALDMSGDLVLDHGPAGLSAGPFPATLGTTLGIGDTQPVEVVLNKELPAGPWDATLTLRSGELEKTVTATILFPEPGEEPETFDAEPVEGKTFWGLIALLFLLLALLLLLSYLWRRHRKKRVEEARRVGAAS